MEGGEIAVVLEFDDGVEVVEIPLVAELPRLADDAAFIDMRQAVAQGGGADQFKDFVVALIGLQHAVAVSDDGIEAHRPQALGLF